MGGAQRFVREGQAQQIIVLQTDRKNELSPVGHQSEFIKCKPKWVDKINDCL